MESEIIKQEKEEKRIAINNLITLIAFTCILAGGGILIFYYITSSINSCTSNPPQYFAENFIEEENITLGFAKVHFYINENDVAPYKSIDVKLGS